MPARKRGAPPAPMVTSKYKRDISGKRVKERHFESKRITLIYSAQLISENHPLNGIKYFGLTDREGLSELEVMNRRRAEHERQARVEKNKAKGIHQFLFEGYHFEWQIEATCPNSEKDCPSVWAQEAERAAIASRGGTYNGIHGPKTTINLSSGGDGTYADPCSKTAILFDIFFKYYSEYVKVMKTNDIRQDHVCDDGYKLGIKVHGIRNKGSLVGHCPERRELLNSLGFIWSTNENSWEKCKEALERYKIKNKHLDVKQDFIDTDNPTDPEYRLGLCVYRIRRGTFGQHDPERLKWLAERGFKMNMYDAALDRFLVHLEEWVKIHNTTKIPQVEKSPIEESYSLGMSASDYKKKYWANRLDAHKIEKLNAVGFDWGKTRRK